jgi:hypothetical protein
MLFRQFSGFKVLINASTYGYDHDEVVQESKPNERNSVVDANCNQVTPAILKTIGRKQHIQFTEERLLFISISPVMNGQDWLAQTATISQHNNNITLMVIRARSQGRGCTAAIRLIVHHVF